MCRGCGLPEKDTDERHIFLDCLRWAQWKRQWIGEVEGLLQRQLARYPALKRWLETLFEDGHGWFQGHNLYWLALIPDDMPVPNVLERNWIEQLVIKHLYWLIGRIWAVNGGNE